MPEEKYKPGSVIFTGAGPGDPDLLTIAAHRVISKADLILYAGSLVNPAILEIAKSDAKKYNSAGMTLEECLQLMIRHARNGELVARVHTGDPTIFGAIAEQIRGLDSAGIEWSIIPGVTAATAAAAAAGISLSMPEYAQGLILARQPGRTKTSSDAELFRLAGHGLPLALYLSGNLVGDVCGQLRKVLPESARVLCAQRVGWPDSRLIWTNLGELEKCVNAENLKEQTVFIVFPREGEVIKSRLYAKDFSHKYRKGVDDRQDN